MHSWSLSREQVKSAAPLGDLPFAVLAVTEQPVGAELLTLRPLLGLELLKLQM